jgi:hypothetical protein
MTPAEDQYLHAEENVMNTRLPFHIEILRGGNRFPTPADSKTYYLHTAYIRSTGMHTVECKVLNTVFDTAFLNRIRSPVSATSEGKKIDLSRIKE